MNNTNLDKNKIVLGLSGGVDSTSAALILREQGFEVIGFYFDINPLNIEGRLKAEKCASDLGIKFIYKDVSKDFENIVIKNFCEEYKVGHTPNPCIVCNPNVKFKSLIEVANEEGAYYIATGHYAGIIQDDSTGLYHLKMAKNIKKDQSYMMYRLGQDVLSRLILPLYDIDDKNETRELARRFNMKNSEDKDSQEICFVSPDRTYIDFLADCGIKGKEGDFIDKEGNTLGKHKGIINYTIGQRKGLGIALGKPAFVTHINCEDNNITLGDNEDLFKSQVAAKDVFFVDPNRKDYSNISAKVRYTTLPAKCKLIVNPEEVVAIFDDPRRAPTPGQSIVFYDGDRVVGGAIIK